MGGLKLCLLCLCIWALGSSCKQQKNQHPNVLFIAVDDLRPELGCFGNKMVKSPNIDALAESGTLYKRHYVSVPTCGASRHALLTGKHPLSKIHLSNKASEKLLADGTSNPETFVHHLRNNGYYTVGIGKISHNPEGRVYEYLESPEGTRRELPQSWDEMLFNSGKWGTAHNAFFGYADGTNRNTLKKQVKPYEAADVDDNGYPDGLTAELAVSKIKELSEKGQPFFLGVGFFKPHLPFNAPKKYWDLYQREDISTAPFTGIPENGSELSLHGSGEFNQYALGDEKATIETSVSKTYAQKLRHAYYACISYTDAQVGKLIEALKKNNLYDNTIIVLWGDHGWHLGDHNIWGKHTCFDRALHSPLIIKSPVTPKGVVDEIVESVDLYPTLMTILNVEKPIDLDGQSLTQTDTESWNDHAFSYFRQGISVRTHDFRLTKYYQQDSIRYELYNHQNDPNETINLAKSAADIPTDLLELVEKADNGLYDR